VAGGGGEVGIDVHHRDVVRVALEKLQREMDGDSRREAMALIARQAGKPDRGPAAPRRRISSPARSAEAETRSRRGMSREGAGNAYFQPPALRVNRGGSAGFASGAAFGSPEASAISRSRASASGSPSSWSVNQQRVLRRNLELLPHALQTTSSSMRSR